MAVQSSHPRDVGRSKTVFAGVNVKRMLQAGLWRVLRLRKKKKKILPEQETEGAKRWTMAVCLGWWGAGWWPSEGYRMVHLEEEDGGQLHWWVGYWGRMDRSSPSSSEKNGISKYSLVHINTNQSLKHDNKRKKA